MCNVPILYIYMGLKQYPRMQVLCPCSNIFGMSYYCQVYCLINLATFALVVAFLMSMPDTKDFMSPRNLYSLIPTGEKMQEETRDL